ncbi:MAG: hypothetical protein ACOYOU_22040, partial [Kiritimatiellia bacterium]
MNSNGGKMDEAWFVIGMTVTQLRRVLCSGIIAGACFWARGQVNAAVVFEDLTPGVVPGSVYTYGSNYQGAPTLTNQYFVGGQWITGTADADQWAQHAFGGSRYVGYVLVGGNVSRVPSSMKVQYTTDASPGAGGTWIDVSSVPPEGGFGLNSVVVDKVATAVRVKISNSSYSDLEAFRVYGSSDLSYFGRMNTNDSAAIVNAATLTLSGTWEVNFGGSTNTFLSNTLVPNGGGSQFRGNGNLATKPVLQLTWASNQLLSGVDLANITWSGSAGSGMIYGMNVDALPQDMDPALATPSDWVTVATYSSSVTVPHLIHLQFDSGSLKTRGLRLVLTS